jgi:hypothetical protein
MAWCSDHCAGLGADACIGRDHLGLILVGIFKLDLVFGHWFRLDVRLQWQDRAEWIFWCLDDWRSENQVDMPNMRNHNIMYIPIILIISTLLKPLSLIFIAHITSYSRTSPPGVAFGDFQPCEGLHSTEGISHIGQ